MAYCLGLGRGSNSTQSANSTIGGPKATGTQKPFTGAAATNQISNSLTAAILIFMSAVGWVGLNL